MTRSFHGDIEGEVALEYLMIYHDEGSASFVGLERVVGRVAGHRGSFVLQHSGTSAGGTMQATVSVVPGARTGDLRGLCGLRGEGSFVWPHGQHGSLTLDYDLA